MLYMVLQPDGMFAVKRTSKKEWGLDLLYREIGCHLVEAVEREGLHPALPPITVWVDEEGLIGAVPLPLNPVASHLGQRPLVGVAVVTGGVSREGETLSLSVDHVSLIAGVCVSALTEILQRRLAMKMGDN